MSSPASPYPFPDELAPPKKKETDEYGLQAARAMYNSKTRIGYGLADDRGYTALTELAQGRQSTENIRRLFGFHDEPRPYGTNTDNGPNAYIDIQVLNLATKYVNKAVAKLQRFKYNIGLSAVDPFSVDEAKDYNSRLQAFYGLRDWFKSFSPGRINMQEMIPEVDIRLLPEYPEELVFNLSINEKIRRIIDGEKTIKLINTTMNDMDQRLRECDWDAVVYGHQHLHCFSDENGMPRVEHINGRYWGSSWVENEDYSKAEYQLFIEFLTANQIKKEGAGKIGEQKMNKILGSNAFPNLAASYGSLPDFITTYDGLKYYPVMRFYFLSNDSVTYVKRTTKEGNKVTDTVPYEYFPKNPDKEAMPASYTSVYGGTWVIDTDVVYNYGRKDIPRTKLVNARLPIISFAPNMKDGRMVSMLAQMVEPLTMINVLHNKVKDTLAKGYNGILEFNLTAFENIALGAGGVNWEPKQAIDFLMQTHIGVTRQTTSPYGQSMGEALKVSPTGITIADYFNSMATYIRFLDDLSGSTIADSNDVPDRLALGALKANIAAGNESLEYLVNAREKMYHQASHMLLLLAQSAKKNKVKIQGMIPALGKYTTEFFEVPDELPYCEYGLMLEREPTPEEWAEFYMDLREAVKEGRLNTSDSTFIRQVNNLKMARQIMANRELINEKKASAIRQEEREFQLKMANAAGQDKLAMEMQLLDKKKRDDLELIKVQAMIDDALLTKELSIKASQQSATDTMKHRIEKEKNIATIIKEATRASAEEYKSNSKSATDLATAGIDARTKEMIAKSKPKPATKSK